METLAALEEVGLNADEYKGECVAPNELKGRAVPSNWVSGGEEWCLGLDLERHLHLSRSVSGCSLLSLFHSEFESGSP